MILLVLPMWLLSTHQEHLCFLIDAGCRRAWLQGSGARTKAGVKLAMQECGESVNIHRL